ncbi:hypothetical protein Tco_0350712, partial [Tanacetum coccineum]
VFSTWMAFRGNTRDLGSLKKLCIQSVETASRVSSDGVRTFKLTASERGQPKETLEDFVS